MEWNSMLERLEKIQRNSPSKIFTMYLNTDPSDPEQQGGEWKIHFKNGMRNFEQYLEKDNNKEELQHFQLVKQKVEKYIREYEQHLMRGIILFATADEEIWFAERVQIRLETSFSWQETPELGQLKEMMSQYPKAGIVLVQQDEIKIIDTFLNEIMEKIWYQLDIDTDDWRVKQGPRKAAPTSGAGSSNLQKEQFAARFKANKQRWYKQIAPKIDKLAKNHHWEEIYILGEADEANEMKAQMNKNVTALIQKNMLDHEETKVLKEVYGS
ncbi:MULTISPECIES: VLRF1 family aeRF1-type release factor [unclassified Virgibacillus]|uniref:VLRF1 family aeRF1-type release factor n=1 Tax=unclassified Virgibacillus TaxID=2620237 RepID=UPI0024DE6122|nr:VLRF1 family aeRF1-type release factor [Virgibacillus sp. LDC-1]